MIRLFTLLDLTWNHSPSLTEDVLVTVTFRWVGTTNTPFLRLRGIPSRQPSAAWPGRSLWSSHGLVFSPEHSSLPGLDAPGGALPGSSSPADTQTHWCLRGWAAAFYQQSVKFDFDGKNKELKSAAANLIDANMLTVTNSPWLVISQCFKKSSRNKVGVLFPTITCHVDLITCD